MMCSTIPATGDGDACSYGFECDEDLQCRDMICQRRLIGLNEECYSLDECIPGLECRDMICKQPLIGFE